MRLTFRNSSGLDYVAEVADELRDLGYLLLSLVAGKPAPADGKSLKQRLDWNIVRLTRTGSEVVVEEPDYAYDSEHFLPGLNFTCAVLHAQQLVHARLEVEAEPVNYDAGVLVYPEGLTAAGMAAIRQDSDLPEDSGWRVFDADRVDWKAEPHALRVYEIAAKRPELLSILSLPAGWSIRMEGRSLAEAVSPEGKHMAADLNISL